MSTPTLLQGIDDGHDGAVPATQDDPALQGEVHRITLVADTYRLVDRIGEGAMGVVYEAEHVRLGRRFALKLMRADAWAKPTAVQRFMREARIAASVHSDNVVSIIDCGQLPDGAPFLVTERLRGQDLRCRLNEVGVLSVGEAVRIAIDACRGIAAVHAAGIVHRDLKPENLFLTERDAGRSICKLLDFGVAKLAAQPVTEDGRLIGTASYMAPEQILDASRVGPEADIYSIGAILFECLSGRPPHDGTTTHAVMFKAVHFPAPKLAALRSDLPADLCDVVGCALAVDPLERFRSARAFAEALAPYGDGPQAFDPAGPQRGPSGLGGGFKYGYRRALVARMLVSAAGGAVLGGLMTAALLSSKARPMTSSASTARAPVPGDSVIAAPNVLSGPALPQPAEVAPTAIVTDRGSGAVGVGAVQPVSSARPSRAPQAPRAGRSAPVPSAATAPALETQSPYRLP
jgi:tRNA A-37 threonylcarbamoyl transferase component Bud32